MVLVPELTAEEKTRHNHLIHQYARDELGREDVNIDLIGYGVHKGVYKVCSGSRGLLVAVGASRELDRLLLEDYVALNELYANAPSFFSKPYAHYTAHTNNLGELISMEYIDMPDLDKLKRETIFGPHLKDLAYRLGRDLGEVFMLTGRYSSEPHDGNVLASIRDGKLAPLKFCDPIQFLPGDLDDVVRSVMTYGDERRECISFAHKFKQGLSEALVEVGGRNQTEASAELAFMTRYSSIL
ncbi:hypothetical protein JW711_06225 [Candidatus Woesearchaeota archaeon]|nr:hypothetical protein [Candidatus Woesearchaeota archaeon]